MNSQSIEISQPVRKANGVTIDDDLLTRFSADCGVFQQTSLLHGDGGLSKQIMTKAVWPTAARQHHDSSELVHKAIVVAERGAAFQLLSSKQGDNRLESARKTTCGLGFNISECGN